MRGFDSFGEVYFAVGHSVNLPDSGISVGITDLQMLDNKSNGGEGGIRTLGTGVSPYNGLAILCFDVMPSNPNHLQSSSITKDHAM